MRRNGILIAGLLCCNIHVHSQDMLQTYKRAERFMAGNISKIIYNENIVPNFIEDGSKFWYKNESASGYEYFLVDPDKKSQERAFNHINLADQLSKQTGKEVDPFHLNLEDLEFTNEEKTITFRVLKKDWEYEIRRRRLTEYAKETDPAHQIKSPDEMWIAFIKENNVWITQTETKDSFQLTNDGTKDYTYGIDLSWYSVKNELDTAKEETETIIYWSPDSKKLIVPKYDRRHAQKLYLYNTTPNKGYRSEVYSYERPLAGDSLLTTVEYVLFDIEAKSKIDLNISPNATFLNYSIEWLPSSMKAYLLKYNRGYKARKLIEIDASTGEVRMLFSEQSDTYVDPLNHTFILLEEVGLFLWMSEKSGWNHIYLHDLETGSPLRQVTSGNFAVSEIKCIDQLKRTIYFTAFGKEPGDPYFKYLYKTDFDGSFIQKVTSTNAYHEIYKSPDKNYFIDVYSSYDQPAKASVYKISTGLFVMDFAQANIDNLINMGWHEPEPFNLKARDDSSDIYGLVYRPSNFDSTKSYPVIDASYSGPHTIRTPKTFRRAVLNNELAIAELGFIVVTIDGLGTAFRSKTFHDFSYQNLGDIGSEDHKKAIKELAERYPYIDTSMVGIYGHSAGGYDAVRALILNPGFYDVAVSSAGNHDHRIAKAWWPELYMGYPVEKHYDEQSNVFNASKIQGKLLLAHGNMDNNVNPSGTLRLVDEMIQANKDFELIITPGDDHGKLYYNPYFIRKRWDFFVRHLLQKEPPHEYKIKAESVK